MSFALKLSECCETVIAALASRIEQLEGELEWKQQRINQLELALDNLNSKPGSDSGRDPFEGGSADE